ncbi:tetratricopeptide repeat protein [Luteimonas sp. J16]|uniref:tetratricopeptide repeat protein n=1 Tax=Luteimonas sp. J16 TaxID=935283 RepID=UPI0011A246CA|nr:tetratricopeptide repeat protein [Luteimonas sp. J16]
MDAAPAPGAGGHRRDLRPDGARDRIGRPGDGEAGSGAAGRHQLRAVGRAGPGQGPARRRRPGRGHRDAARGAQRRPRAGGRHPPARLLVDAGQGEEAVSLLAGNDDPGALEVRGDAHFALGRADEARKDYEAALRKLDVAAPQRMLLELKLAQAGGTPDQAGTES